MSLEKGNRKLSGGSRTSQRPKPLYTGAARIFQNVPERPGGGQNVTGGKWTFWDVVGRSINQNVPGLGQGISADNVER